MVRTQREPGAGRGDSVRARVAYGVSDFSVKTGRGLLLSRTGMTEDDSGRKALSGFLSETTRKARRTLLVLSVTVLVVKQLNLKFETLVILGNTITIPDERVLIKLVEYVLLYLMILFCVYVTGDLALIKRASVIAVIHPNGRLKSDAVRSYCDARVS